MILSSSPIVGNERSVYNTINKLTILGCNVVHSKMDDIHTSGHGNAEELARMINYVKPKYLIPIHGEYYMRNSLKQIALKDCGMSEDKIIMCVNGSIVSGNIAEKEQLSLIKETASARQVLVDGKGEGYLDSYVQKDREIMSKNGVILAIINVSRKSRKLVGRPHVISRGFLYNHEPCNDVINQMADVFSKSYRDFNQRRPGANRRDIKKYLGRKVEDFAKRNLSRIPLVIPMIIEV